MRSAFGQGVAAAELAMLAGHWLTLWLGLYLLSRRPRSRAAALAAGAFVAVSSYFVSAAFMLAPQRLPNASLWNLWVGTWWPLAPALLFHSVLSLTGLRPPGRRAVLALVYAVAATVSGFSWVDGLLYRYIPAPPGAVADVNGTLATGPAYPLLIAQVLVTLALTAVVLVASGGTIPKSVRRVQRRLAAAVFLMIVGASALFANMLSGGHLRSESVLGLLLIVGGVVFAHTFNRHPGWLEGQLLRDDLKASLIGAVLLMTAFTTLVLAGGGSFTILAGLGWLLLATFIFSEELRRIADLAIFGAGSRAQRNDLRLAADYAGSSRRLDVAALTSPESSDLVAYLSAVDRAGIAAERLHDGDPRLTLLGRDEFAAVRQALGLPAAWTPRDGLAAEDVRTRVLVVLEPRERQALGLKYLGYSDKEMSELMGVKPGVPRSYLSAGKRKLGLSAGAPMMLFVHFAGLVDVDALPLLAERASGAGGDGARSGTPAWEREEDAGHPHARSAASAVGPALEEST